MAIDGETSRAIAFPQNDWPLNKMLMPETCSHVIEVMAVAAIVEDSGR